LKTSRAATFFLAAQVQYRLRFVTARSACARAKVFRPNRFSTATTAAQKIFRHAPEVVSRQFPDARALPQPR
jgi:hypothetical protein